MRCALAALALSCAAVGPALADIDVGGEPVEVVDMHLHTGAWATQPLSAKQFIVSVQPAPFRLYGPALTDALTGPYAPHIGIRAQTEWAGVDHAVLLATYTHHTVGYMTNSALAARLADDRNAGWAWGMASINLDDISDPTVRAARVAALGSYFEQLPERFIGIKLAHAHQAIDLDDEVMTDVYDVAVEYGVPVLLHTGFSPFPNSQTDPAYYDPIYLRAIAERYDGRDGRPRVDFVLSHIGQGDARATASALAMAEELPNIWLELSALSGPLRIDADGEPITATDPQYPGVLAEILDRGLVDRTMFATDGPQYSGKILAYTGEIADAMVAAGYRLEQIRAVMAGNFYALYGVTGD